MAEGDTEQEPRERSQHEASNRTPIVGIGASAGGLAALIAFFAAIPADIGAAFVVIVHLDPEVKSELASILAAKGRLPATQIATATEIRPNHVYVISPDRQLRITDHEVSTLPFSEPRGRRAPIDVF